MAKKKTPSKNNGKSKVVKKKSKNNKPARSFKIEEMHKPSRKKSLTIFFISFASILIVLLLSAWFVFIGTRALIENTHSTVRATAVGLSSLSIEAINQDKRAIISRYMQNIDGLHSGYVVEYEKQEVRGALVPASGRIIGVASHSGMGRRLSQAKFEELRHVSDFQIIETNIVLSGQSGIPLKYYEYRYPVLWRARASTGAVTSVAEGVIVLRYLERDMIKKFYKQAIPVGIAALIAIIVVFRLTLLAVGLTKQLEEKIAEVERLSVTDELTKIYNRKKFNEVLAAEITRAERYSKDLALIMFDIDHFKKVNDTYGHDVGDYVIVKVVEIVKTLVRDTDLLARWGGEEFMLLTPDTDRKGARNLASRIRAKIADTNFEHVETITCSFGVSSLEEKDDLFAFIKRTDNALYNAKESGRNCVRMS